MMRLLVVVGLALFGWFAVAETEVEHNLYVGLGLATGLSSMKVQEGKGTSRFWSHGILADAGAVVAFTNSFGMGAGVEVGQISANNVQESQASLEVSQIDYQTFKLGFVANHVEFGGLYQHRKAITKSLNPGPSGFSSTEYVGWPAGGYANLSYSVNKNWRAAAEVQYVKGTLKAGPTLPSVEASDISVSLRMGWLLF